MGSWSGEQELLAECKDSQGKKVVQALIDPTKESNYLFLKNFFDEVFQIFPENFIHLGGDEVKYWIQQCW